MQYVKTRQCSLFKIFRIMCLLLLRILFQPLGKLPEQWDENQHKSHGSQASIASELHYFIQHWAFTCLRYMNFTILMKMKCYIWTSWLVIWWDGLNSYLFFWYWNTVFFCAMKCEFMSTTCWFSWMINNLGMVLLFVILPQLSFILVNFSVPVCILPGIAGAMAPVRSCFLPSYLLSPALPGTWKKKTLAFLQQSLIWKETGTLAKYSNSPFGPFLMGKQ